MCAVSKVAYIYDGYLWGTRLDREIFAFNNQGDRVRVGQNLTITVPLTAGETAVVGIAADTNPGLTLGGFCGVYRLGATMLPLYTATSQAPTYTTTIPNTTSLAGVAYLQGLRSGGATADITRMVELRVFP